jgi:MFS family permease
VLLDTSIFAPDVGWRVAFLIGAVLGVGILIVRRHVPESPRWLFIHGRDEEAERIVSAVEDEVHESTGEQLDEPGDSITVRQRKTISFRTIASTAFKRYLRRTALGFALFVGQAFIYNAVTFGLGTFLAEFYDLDSGRVPLYIALFAVSNFAGPLLLGRLFDTVGRKPMIAGTYLGSAAVLTVLTILFVDGTLGLWGFMALLLLTFFLASAGASSAYLTVSEIFPMETRALAIAFFYAIGTAVGGITGPFLVGKMIESGEESQVAVAFLLGAEVMALGGIVELVYGVKAEGEDLESIAKPLTPRRPSSARATGRASTPHPACWSPRRSRAPGSSARWPRSSAPWPSAARPTAASSRAPSARASGARAGSPRRCTRPCGQVRCGGFRGRASGRTSTALGKEAARSAALRVCGAFSFHTLEKRQATLPGAFTAHIAVKAPRTLAAAGSPPPSPSRGSSLRAAEARPSERAEVRPSERRVAAQHPAAPVAPQPVPAGQLGQRARDRRAAGGGEVAQDLVREREVEADAVGTNLPVAVGQLPEQRPQALVQPRLLSDHHHRRQPAGAGERAPRQRRPHARVGCHPLRPSEVEDRHPRARQHLPAPLDAEDVLAVELPRTQQVAGGQQLGSKASAVPRAPDQDAVQHEQTEAVARAIGLRPCVPQPLRHVEHRRAARLARGAAACFRRQLGEIGVLVKDIDGHRTLI